jgi:adenylosuccinate synthase
LDDLPIEAKEYLGFISDYLKAPISILSLGPDRTETVNLKKLY